MSKKKETITIIDNSTGMKFEFNNFKIGRRNVAISRIHL